MKGAFLQLKTVVWKNFVIRRRHLILAVCEVLLPVLLFLFIAYGRSKISGLSKIEVSGSTHFQENCIFYDHLSEVQFLYAPNDGIYNDIMRKTQIKLSSPNHNIKSFGTPDELLSYYVKNHNSSTIAIIFQDNDVKKFNYVVRWFEPGTEWRTNELYQNVFSFQPGINVPLYFFKDFLSLQKALDVSYIETVSNKNIDNDLTLCVREFPYPPHNEDSGLNSLFIMFLPIMTLFSFIFICPAVLKRVVEEKHSGIKELMKMVGMKSWMLWLGWFIYGMLPMIVSVIVIVILMKVPFFDTHYPLIEYSNGVILFLFLLLYCMAATCSCFFISTWFSKPTLAMIVGLLIWILSYFIPKFLLEAHPIFKVSFGLNLFLMLFPNMALHYGYAAMSTYEEREIGVQWDNIYKSGSTDGTVASGSEAVTMLWVLIMLLVDIVLYTLLTCYVDSVNPGEYGIRKSMFYPITALRNFVFKQFRKRDRRICESEKLPLENIEKGVGLAKGIEVINLCKKFGTKVAVSNLNMDIYREQITVLLGHNGAGKSTTMSMLTGMIESTAGTILIEGKDVRTQPDEIRQNFGLCPQHNLLFPDLTVSEHLEFFARLKGRTHEEAKQEIKVLLEKLHLTKKANEMAHTLSGGMKRKLCLGMAVIGGSKVLILDEPTSGMDPESRRELWDLLLSWRGQKTILITTHFMEEADALGDWIAIMANGRLQCYGTPIYLKKRYATGYHLSLIIKPDAKLHKIQDIVTGHIRSADFKGADGNNVTFVLPFDSGDKFVGMFEDLESKKEELLIETFSVTITTLEDVFLKAKIEEDQSTHSTNNECRSNSISSSASSLDPHKKSLGLTTKSLVRKRFLYFNSKLRMYLSTFLIGLLFFILTICLSNSTDSYLGSSGPEIKLTLNAYGNTKVFYNGSKGNEIIDKLVLNYGETIKSHNGIGLKVSDVENALIQEGISNIVYYNKHTIAAAEFLEEDGKIRIHALYNSVATHSSPISLNLISNALAKTFLGPEYSISISNWPLEVVGEVSPNELSEIKITLLWLIIVPIGCLFILSCFIFFPHMELSTNFTQLQFMAGVRPVFYWLINFCTDFALYFIAVIVVVAVSLFWTPMTNKEALISLFVILMGYGFSGIPFTYLFCRHKSASSAFALFIIFGLFVGVLLTIVLMFLMESQDTYYMNIGYHLRDVCLVLFPQFGLTYLGSSFARTAIKSYNFQIMPPNEQKFLCLSNQHPCCHGRCQEGNIYMQNLQDEHFGLMFISGVFYFGIIVFLHSYVWKRICAKISLYYYKIKSNTFSENNDKSVTSNCENYNSLKVNKLKKTYSGKEVVKNINFNLEKGTCLGILGVNGAGKTTTFRMLTREEVRDEGTVTADGDKIDNNNYLGRLGYCPQYDSLNFVLTGRQILTTMAELRGVSKPEALVNEFLELFELKELADIPCGDYSGGNKRKLSLAVAIIGFPDYVLLDEPTNGVDPSARRKFWTLIKKVQNSKKTSFVLTSHSMAECEALCNNLKIMKDGTFHKEGTISELKQSVNGYSVKLKLKTVTNVDTKEEDYDEVDGIVQSSDARFESVDQLKKYFTNPSYAGEIKDEHSGLLHVYIRKNNKRWSQLFKEMEQLKVENPHLIEDYSISEASLEDVFLSVARDEHTTVLLD